MNVYHDSSPLSYIGIPNASQYDTPNFHIRHHIKETPEYKVVPRPRGYEAQFSFGRQRLNRRGGESNEC